MQVSLIHSPLGATCGSLDILQVNILRGCRHVSVAFQAQANAPVIVSKQQHEGRNDLAQA